MLPGDLKTIVILGSNFTGFLGLSKFPHHLKEANFYKKTSRALLTLRVFHRLYENSIFSYNPLSDSLDLTNQPEALRDLELIHNQFCVELSLDQLPRSFWKFDLNNNQFQGSLDLSQ